MREECGSGKNVEKGASLWLSVQRLERATWVFEGLCISQGMHCKYFGI
jgi:hypothetical protein